jgi:endonuclease/exonuclease/phosphatase family metal-dependent hydrolase
MRWLLPLACFVFLTGSSAQTLEIATWNMEWLIAPNVLRPMREHCAPQDTPIRGNDRRVPCDVALKFNRSEADFRAYARYAKELDADVVALQEVDGASAASLAFPGYDFCFTARRHVQNNGFAIRKGVPHRCEADLQTLSNNDSVRRGAVVTLFPGDRREIRLLSVHLKSGCNRDVLISGRKACRELSRQVQPLEDWIDAQARAGTRFAVLGDFNRNLLKDDGPARSGDGRHLHLWSEIDDGSPPEADLVNAAENQPFINCSPKAHYSAYIDYIVLGKALGRAVVPGSFGRLLYRAGDDRTLKLSDHCPVSVRVGL